MYTLKDLELLDESLLSEEEYIQIVVFSINQKFESNYDQNEVCNDFISEYAIIDEK